MDNLFYPLFDVQDKSEWIYIVNYYGQLCENKIKEFTRNYQNIIDNAQSYFTPPLPGTHTIYTCRKFFGVSDGGILFTNKYLSRKLDNDYSYERIKFVLGRYEKNASEFFYYHHKIMTNLMMKISNICHESHKIYCTRLIMIQLH